MKGKTNPSAISGDRLLRSLDALGHPQRLRIMAVLTRDGRNYVSQLAREVGISRPLLNLHLHRLEAAGLVASQLELSPDGKSLKYFEILPFNLVVSPNVIVEAVKSLTVDEPVAES